VEWFIGMLLAVSINCTVTLLWKQANVWKMTDGLNASFGRDIWLRATAVRADRSRRIWLGLQLQRKYFSMPEPIYACFSHE